MEHTNTRKRSGAQPTEQVTEQVRTLPPAPAPQTAELIKSYGMKLPAANKPAVNAEEPAISYKIPRSWAATPCFSMSSDLGVTTTPSGVDSLCGYIEDLFIDIMPATWTEGETDYRLRLHFRSEAGELHELNLNAVADKRGTPGIKVSTVPARSLISALLETSDSDDDIEALRNGFRVLLFPGARNNAMFIELSVLSAKAEGEGDWVVVGGPQAFRRIGADVMDLLGAIRTVKANLRARGMLRPTPAIRGDIPEGALESAAVEEAQPTVVDVVAHDVDEEIPF
jgi:hypothetical protein